MVFRCRGLVGSITRHIRGRGRTRQRDVGSTTELGRNRTENVAEAGNVTGM